MVNTSSSKAEQIGNYRRRYLNGRFYWITNDNKYIDGEVQVGNWILKPNGTKVHITARLANRQAARNKANTQTTRWDDMQAADTLFAADKLDQNFDGYYIFPNPHDPNNLITSQESPESKLPINTNQVKKRVTLRRPNYALNFSNLNLSDIERKYIQDAGFNPDDARSVQEFILSKSKNANLGARAGIGIADGYWGKKSATAFLALRNLNIFAPIVDEQKQSAPIIEQPIDAPDPFGYTTSNHYGDGMVLKGLGFNNYAGLQAYAKTSEDLFAKDLKQRFGNDVSAWNQATVEGDLGVSGKYRGGRAGDFGDMARSMATWAGETNAAYDRKKDISSRMETARQQYANELAKKYTPLLSKPTVEDPSKKFMIGNVGTNTLGNAGVGLLGEDWVKHALQTGYFPTK